MFFAKGFRDNLSLIIDRFTSIIAQVTGNGLNLYNTTPIPQPCMVIGTL